jgi:hypothetical protein
MANYGYGYTAPPAAAPQRNGCRTACFGCLIGTVVLLCLTVGATLLLWPVIRSTASAQIGNLAITALDDTAAAEGITTDPIGDLVASVPPGEYLIELAQLRTALAGAGLPAAEFVEFDGNRLVIPLEGMSLPGSFSTEIGAAAGRLIFIDPRVEGPLGALVDPAGLLEPLLLRLNEAVITQERSIEQAAIDGGRLIIVFR